LPSSTGVGVCTGLFIINPMECERECSRMSITDSLNLASRIVGLATRNLPSKSSIIHI